MDTPLYRIDVLEASHDPGSHQSLVQLLIGNPSETAMSGFVHVEYLRYMDFRGDVQHNPEKGEIPMPPDWYLARHGDLGTPADFLDVLEKVRSTRDDPEFQSMVTQPKVQKLSEEVQQGRAGYILSSKVADSFANIDISTANRLVMLDRVFPLEREPWHYLRVSLNDHEGKRLVTYTWTPW